MGDISVDGVSIRTDPIAAKARMAYILENPELFDYLTGIRYLNFIADVFSISAALATPAEYGHAARAAVCAVLLAATWAIYMSNSKRPLSEL